MDSISSKSLPSLPDSVLLLVVACLDIQSIYKSFQSLCRRFSSLGYSSYNVVPLLQQRVYLLNSPEYKIGVLTDNVDNLFFDTCLLQIVNEDSIVQGFLLDLLTYENSPFCIGGSMATLMALLVQKKEFDIEDYRESDVDIYTIASQNLSFCQDTVAYLLHKHFSATSHVITIKKFIVEVLFADEKKRKLQIILHVKGSVDELLAFCDLPITQFVLLSEKGQRKILKTKKAQFSVDHRLNLLCDQVTSETNNRILKYGNRGYDTVLETQFGGVPGSMEQRIFAVYGIKKHFVDCTVGDFLATRAFSQEDITQHTRAMKASYCSIMTRKKENTRQVCVNTTRNYYGTDLEKKLDKANCMLKKKHTETKRRMVEVKEKEYRIVFFDFTEFETYRYILRMYEEIVERHSTIFMCSNIEEYMYRSDDRDIRFSSRLREICLLRDRHRICDGSCGCGCNPSLSPSGSAIIMKTLPSVNGCSFLTDSSTATGICQPTPSVEEGISNWYCNCKCTCFDSNGKLNSLKENDRKNKWNTVRQKYPFYASMQCDEFLDIDRVLFFDFFCTYFLRKNFCYKGEDGRFYPTTQEVIPEEIVVRDIFLKL